MPQFIQDTCTGLQAAQPAVVRISAVRAIWGFCDHLRRHEEKRRALLAPVLPSMLDALLNMCIVFNSLSEVMGLILENMAIVLAVGY